MKRILAFTVVLVFSAATAYAGCVETLGIGAKETAQGKAVAAQADTPFATYYNPAGLTQIKSPTIAAGTMVYDAQVTIDKFTLKDKDGNVVNNGWANDCETDNDPLLNPAIGYAMPLNDKFSFGIAAYAPYGLHIESDKNPYNNPISFYAWESYYARTTVNPTIAYKFSDKLSFGFGVSLGQSESDAGKTYRTNPFQGKLTKTISDNQGLLAGIGSVLPTDLAQVLTDTVDDIKQTIKTNAMTDIANKSDRHQLKLESEDSFNMSWNAGILYKPTKKLSLGLTYRSRATADFDGDVFYGGKRIGSVTMDYDHPDQVQGGIRYAFSDTFSVEFDMTFTHWSINDKQVEKMEFDADMMSYMLGEDVSAKIAGISGNKETILAVLKPKLTDEQYKKVQQLFDKVGGSGGSGLVADHNRNWDNTIQYQLGAEWLVNHKLALRAGIIYDPTPVPDETFDNGWPDTDRTLLNFGVGYQLTEKWNIDATFQYIRSTPARDIDGDSEELNNGYSEGFGQEGMKVYLEDNVGELFGLGCTVTYKF